MRKINQAIIHCSDSAWGSVRAIDQWHRRRGFNEIGYHYVLTNGHIQPPEYLKSLDGQICPGRPIQRQGAHCKGHNRDSVGICLIGKDEFTEHQFLSLVRLLDELRNAHNFEAVWAHNHYNEQKTCPNFNVNQVLRYEW